MKKLTHARDFIKQECQEFLRDERGVTIKSIIIIVATVVVVGAVAMWLAGGQMEIFISQVWEALGGWLDSEFGFGW